MSFDEVHIHAPSFILGAAAMAIYLIFVLVAWAGIDRFREWHSSRPIKIKSYGRHSQRARDTRRQEWTDRTPTKATQTSSKSSVETKSPSS